ncbi:MAG: ribosome maturation factor RimP [Eubacteriales bacterium]|nr:ribosome maturation factor RimP [Eubacteriales bacterium]
MKKTEIVERVEELVTPIINENDFELVDVEYVKEGANWYLRVFADKEGGITIDDCVFISRALEEKLDAEDFISEAYILEVSSPGLGRQLKKEKDFQRSLGDKVECKLFKAVDGQKEFEGILKAYTGETVTLELEAEKKEIVIDRSEIAVIRQAIDF